MDGGCGHNNENVLNASELLIMVKMGNFVLCVFDQN